MTKCLRDSFSAIFCVESLYGDKLIKNRTVFTDYYEVCCLSHLKLSCVYVPVVIYSHFNPWIAFVGSNDCLEEKVDKSSLLLKSARDIFI